MREKRTGRIRGRVGTSCVVAWGLLGSAFLASCDPSDGIPLGLTIEEIASPARGWSAAPNLTAGGDAVILSWLETRADSDGRETTLLADRWTGGGESWDGPRTISSGSDIMVNWADFPSTTVAPDGALAAHWLVRHDDGGYGIRVSVSPDGGRSWSRAWTPHEDGTAAEHGFASLVPVSSGVVRGARQRSGEQGSGTAETEFGIVWLDGRASASEGDVALWHRAFGSEGATAPEKLLDDLTCECCQTDVAATSDGLVVAYRDRTREEVRDIYVTRLIGGAWESPRPVHEDGWVFPACPVNGPAVDADGDTVAVAWFTSAGDDPRINLAFSADGGASFGPPARIDGGDPAGRVDVALLSDDSALVTWIERVEGAAEVRVRRVARSGRMSPPARVGGTGAGQSGGFPRMAVGPGDEVLFAWTDSREGDSRVRVARGTFGVDLPSRTTTGGSAEDGP